MNTEEAARERMGDQGRGQSWSSILVGGFFCRRKFDICGRECKED